MRSSHFQDLGSFIDYSAMKNANDLKKWRRLASLQKRTARYDELRRRRRVKERMHVDEILEELWKIIPPLPSRNILNMRVKILLKQLKTKGLTRGREMRKTIAALLFLILTKENLNSHAAYLIKIFSDIEEIAKVFENNLALTGKTLSERESF